MGLVAALTFEQLWQPVPGGSGTYIRELVGALQGTGVEVVGLAARHGEAGSSEIGAPVRSSRLPRPLLYEAWSRLRRPRAEAICGAVDVVHATTWALPGRTAPLVVTVHDLAFLRDPQHFTARGNAFFRRALAIARDEAAVVVVPSEATRADCLAAGIDADRLVVVRHGVRADEVDATARARWAERFGVHRPYVLWCGTLEPRKNVSAVVEGYRRAREVTTEPVDLVLAGPTGWGGVDARVGAELGRLPVGSVHLVGRLSPADLQVAHAGASAFVFPSLWEGFGMPVLEAMAHGVPVVTSRGTSMAEFAEGAGVLVDPRDPDAIAAGLVASLGPQGAAWGDLGRRRAAGMTWTDSADGHAAVYRRAASRGAA